MSRREYATALHEATHAIVGLALGLPILWASVVPGYDEEERMAYPAAVKIRDEAAQDPRLVLTATAAPSFVPTGDEAVDAYAEIEAGLAFMRAEEAGLDPDQIQLAAEREAKRSLRAIEELAHKLVAEGRVEFEPVAA